MNNRGDCSTPKMSWNRFLYANPFSKILKSNIMQCGKFTEFHNVWVEYFVGTYFNISYSIVPLLHSSEISVPIGSDFACARIYVYIHIYIYVGACGIVHGWNGDLTWRRGLPL